MLYVKRSGALNKPLVVLLHGFLGSHKDLLPLAKALKENYQILLIDIPCHGCSKEGPLLDTLYGYLKEEQGPFHLMGYSMGGRLALLLQSKLPKALSVTVISSHFGLDTEDEKIKRLEQDANWCRCLENMPFSTFLQRWYEQPLFASLRRKKRVFESMLKRREKNSPRALKRALEELSLAKMEKIDSLTIPCLALFGMLDTKFAKLYTKLPQSVQVVGISHAGHTLILEDPLMCAQIFDQFYKRSF